MDVLRNWGGLNLTYIEFNIGSQTCVKLSSSSSSLSSSCRPLWAIQRPPTLSLGNLAGLRWGPLEGPSVTAETRSANFELSLEPAQSPQEKETPPREPQ
eukprot:414586-Pyramimonas_sp.AAC.1